MTDLEKLREGLRVRTPSMGLDELRRRLLVIEKMIEVGDPTDYVLQRCADLKAAIEAKVPR